MLSDALLGVIIGGTIGFLSSIGVGIILNRHERKIRKKLLLNAIHAAIRSSMRPVITSAFTGGDHFNPARTFLTSFWRDLPLLGTKTQRDVVDFFTMLEDTHKTSATKDLLDPLNEIRKNLEELLEKEKQGIPQNIT